jgi:predicted ArsR family transcriptional regulator
VTPVTVKIALKISARLQKKALSAAEIAMAGGLKLPTARRHLQGLIDDKLVHVESWGDDPRGYPTVRLYRWGRKKDAPRPTAATPAERMAACRARRKAS